MKEGRVRQSRKSWGGGGVMRKGKGREGKCEGFMRGIGGGG